MLTASLAFAAMGLRCMRVSSAYFNHINEAACLQGWEIGWMTTTRTRNDLRDATWPLHREK